MYRKFYLYLLTMIFYQFLTFAIHGQTPYDSNIRPVRDNVGFCWDAGEMDHFVDFLSKENSGSITSDNLVAAISVHDDYLYAGNVYYPLYSNIKTREVVIFGVTHGTVIKEMGPLSGVLIMDGFSGWRGPYGNVKISPLREIIKSQLPGDYFIVSNKAHSTEHSIEALIPFLQYYNRDIKITPIMVTQMPLERMEEVSAKLSSIIVSYAKKNKLVPGKDIFFLISNDADHYGEDFKNSPYGLDAKAHEKATANDRRIIQKDLEGPVTKVKIKETAADLWPDSSKKDIPLWCGRYSIVFGLETISRFVSDYEGGSIIGKLTRYSDTFTEKVLPVKNTGMGLTAVFSYNHWCGWFTEGFYLAP